MNVYQRLNDARNKFHSLKLEKTGHNKFAGYKYFELGDFLIPALRVFGECGLCAYVSFKADEACMFIRDVEKPEDVIYITSPMGSAALKGCHEVQNIGAVETYQRRYLWVAALEIVEHDALDAITGKDSPAGKTFRISATDGAGAGLTEQRRAEIDDLALTVIDAHREGRDLPAIEAYNSIEDNDDKVYFWACLKAESKLRAAIKANGPKK